MKLTEQQIGAYRQRKSFAGWELDALCDMAKASIAMDRIEATVRLHIEDLRRLEAENAALRELINNVATQIDSMGTSVTVAAFGNSLLNRIDAARKK